MRIFLIGMLCGVMITAAVTYAFAIPANSDYWRMEICKRGGAAGLSDKSWPYWLEVDGRTDPRYSPKKPVIAPPSAVKVKSERLVDQAKFSPVAAASPAARTTSQCRRHACHYEKNKRPPVFPGRGLIGRKSKIGTFCDQITGQLSAPSALRLANRLTYQFTSVRTLRASKGIRLSARTNMIFMANPSSISISSPQLAPACFSP